MTKQITNDWEERFDKELERYSDLKFAVDRLRMAAAFDVKAFIQKELQASYELGKNDSFWESSDYLSSEAYSIACTLQQRLNQETKFWGLGKDKMEQVEEMRQLANKLVGIVKKIQNNKPTPDERNEE